MRSRGLNGGGAERGGGVLLVCHVGVERIIKSRKEGEDLESELRELHDLYQRLFIGEFDGPELCALY